MANLKVPITNGLKNQFVQSVESLVQRISNAVLSLARLVELSKDVSAWRNLKEIKPSSKR
jgi:hypothetical protein